MTRLSAEKLLALNQAVQEIYAVAWEGKLIEKLPGIVARVVPGEFAMGNLLDSRGMIGKCGINPALPNFPEVAANFSVWAHEHPTLGRRPVAQGISEHRSRQAWHRTGLYSEWMRGLGVEDDLGLDVALEGGLQMAFCVERRGWTFQPEERAMMDLLGPHVRQAWEQSERMVRSALAHGFPEPLERAVGHGVIRADERGRVLACSARTRAHLEKFTGVPRGRSHLPPPVLEWFQKQCRLQRERRPADEPPAVLRLAGHPTTLAIQFVVDAVRGQFYLVLEEKPDAPHPGLLRPLGLSSREQDVLFWVAQGKGNQTVAQILGISVHTVKRHLEKIYAKLGLDGRHAASCFAQEYLHRAQPME